MKFKQIERQEDGSLSFSVETSPAEVAWLVDYAVGDLLREGVIAVSGVEDQEVSLRSNLN